MNIETAIKNYSCCIPKGTTTVIFNLHDGVYIIEFYDSKENYSIGHLLKNEAFCNGYIKNLEKDI